MFCCQYSLSPSLSLQLHWTENSDKKVIKADKILKYSLTEKGKTFFSLSSNLKQTQYPRSVTFALLLLDISLSVFQMLLYTIVHLWYQLRVFRISHWNSEYLTEINLLVSIQSAISITPFFKCHWHGLFTPLKSLNKSI